MTILQLEDRSDCMQHGDAGVSFKLGTLVTQPQEQGLGEG